MRRLNFLDTNAIFNLESALMIDRLGTQSQSAAFLDTANLLITSVPRKFTDLAEKRRKKKLLGNMYLFVNDDEIVLSICKR